MIALLVAGCAIPPAEESAPTVPTWQPPTCATVMCDPVECEEASIVADAPLRVSITANSSSAESTYREPIISEFCWIVALESPPDAWDPGRWVQDGPARFPLRGVGHYRLGGDAPIDDGTTCRWYIAEEFDYDGKNPVDLVADYSARCA